jgi:hypothetical protein
MSSVILLLYHCAGGQIKKKRAEQKRDFTVPEISELEQWVGFERGD